MKPKSMFREGQFVQVSTEFRYATGHVWRILRISGNIKNRRGHSRFLITVTRWIDGLVFKSVVDEKYLRPHRLMQAAIRKFARRRDENKDENGT